LKGGAVAFGSSRRDEVGAISRALARLATHVESSQDALKDALARSRALRERSLDAMILIDEQGRIEDFNQAAVLLFGYSASEAIGQNVSMLMPDPDRSAHDSYLAQYRATGERRIIGMPRHVQGLCKSGEILEIELHVSEVEIGGRRLFDGTIRDIGRRVAMEQRFRQEAEERRRSEERFALAMRGANDGLWDWNVRTGEVYYSPQYARMVGYEPGELEPNVSAWRPLIHPDDIERMVRQVALFLKGPDDAFQYDFRMLHKSGTVVDILARGFRMKGDDGRVERVVGTHVDITELKRVQQDLTKRNEALDLLGQIAVATNAARSADQALTDVLSLICGFLDWPVGHAFLRDEATGVLRATELWRLGDEAKYGPFRAASMKWDGRELPFIVDAMRERNARFAPDFASNDRYPRSGAAAACGLASGVAVPVLAHGEVEAVLEFFSSSGTAPEAHVMQVLNQTAPYIGRAIERNRARNRLEQAKQEAERANAAKTVFLTNMSHELRTPLNSVIGFSEILLGSKLEAAELEYVSHIKAGGQHLLDLVNDLIDLSRIEEGRMEPRRSRFFMVAEIDSIIAQIEPQLLEKALTVATTIHGIDEMTTIHVEQRAFRIILLNLLSNAIKYSPAGGLIQVEAEARGRGCRLVVADKGPGLPEADLERAFERFEQLKGDAYDPGLGGAGIGLPLCR
ncbi:MAG: PAS domain S-box protein, partial [Alphaproteobacteria bacterium]